MTQAIEKNNPKTIKGWLMFDWANSVYSLVIQTAIFPIYFNSVTEEKINIFGVDILNSALYSFGVTITYIIMACLSPLLSGIADSTGRRLFFLRVFSTLGAFSCMSMFFFTGTDTLIMGMISFVLSGIGFSGSLVFYDSFLPIITTEDKYDRISAKGFSYGYVGSVICLIAILILIQKPEWFGMVKSTLQSRIGFLMVGLWWLGFSQYTFAKLPQDDRKSYDTSMFSKGYDEIKKVIARASQLPNLKRFLISFFCYSAGVQTVIYVATPFAQEELKMEAGELILVVLLIQLIGIVGAFLFSRLSEKKGNKLALLIQVFIWFVICIAAFLCSSKGQFYALAIAVGMVMGGVQALSRASYAKLLPEDTVDYTSFYSLYDVTYKVAVVFGTFSFGLVNQLTGNMRYSVLTLGAYFLMGFFLMLLVKFKKRSLL